MTKPPIPTTDRALPFTPPSLGKTSPVVFMVKPLAPIDYDHLALELFRMNLNPRGQLAIRTVIIDELFNMRIENIQPPLSAEGAEAAAEEEAVMLDEFWELDEAHVAAVQEWMQRDRERQRDISAGAPPLAAEPKPLNSLSMRKRLRCQRLIEEIMERPRVREFIANDQRLEVDTSYNITRLVLLGWEGLDTPFEREDGIVPADVMRSMTLEIGKQALRELNVFVSAQGILTLEEVGNLGLPAGGAGAETGSEITNEGSDSSDGNLTESPIDQTQAAE